MPKPSTTAATEPATGTPSTPTRIRGVLARLWRAVTRTETTTADVLSKPTRHTL
jgi:hypothetical protein